MNASGATMAAALSARRPVRSGRSQREAAAPFGGAAAPAFSPVASDSGRDGAPTPFADVPVTRGSWLSSR